MCCKGIGKGRCTVHMLVKILVIVGGLNWGLVGLGTLMGVEGGWNVVEKLLGTWPTVEAVVYVLVGLAALVKIFGCKCKVCKNACVEEGEQKPM
ncbi:MAG: DUF378 domain-containing protein [Candidatus Paceibacterota bacterium]